MSTAAPLPNASSDTNDLHLGGIEKSFGSHTVLRGITLDIPDGEFVTLLGPSGCGKTTLLRIIAGFEKADQGSVYLGSQNLSVLPPHHRPVNTVFQSYALFPHLTVYENIAFGLESRKMPESEIRHRVGSILESVRISDLAIRKPMSLSGGQKQRVALARALINEPEILLLDEPLSALDANLRKDLQAELKSLQRKSSITFILVTHDQDEAIAVSDRILVMNEGRIEQDGHPEDVYERPVSRFVAEFIGSANMLDASHMAGLEVSTSIGHLVVPQVPAWQRGTLAIRPEDIEVRDHDNAENSIPGLIQERLFRGDHWELRVDCRNQILRVITSPDQCHELGQQVFLELPANDLQVLRD